MNNVSTYLRNQLVNCALRNTPYTPPATVYLALYTSDPTTEDVGTEISGGGYQRQPINFGAPIAAGSGSGVVSNTATITFPQATAAQGTAAYAGIRDAQTGGNLLFFGPMQYFAYRFNSPEHPLFTSTMAELRPLSPGYVYRSPGGGEADVAERAAREAVGELPGTPMRPGVQRGRNG